MAIPVVHIAPPGTNAVDARGMAKWLSGGGSMVVSSGTGLYRCTCVHAEFNVGRVRDCGCAVEGPGAMGPRDTKVVRECKFLRS